MDKQNGYVRVMRSHDYNQFEVCLPILLAPVHNWHDEVSHSLYLKHVDDRRKDAARLVDKAVSQYQNAMMAERLRIRMTSGGQSTAFTEEEFMVALSTPPKERDARQKVLARIAEQENWLRDHPSDRNYDDDAPDLMDPQVAL